jgi:hypothetical protein
VSVAEKPLNVQVAEALGTCHVLGEGRIEDKEVSPITIRYCVLHDNCGPFDFETDYDGRVLAPHYDTDWAATGPLIKKHHVHLGERLVRKDGSEELEIGGWFAGGWDADEETDKSIGFGPVPLIAVCNLILKLAEEGKLDPSAE